MIVRIALVAVVGVALLLLGFWLNATYVANPRVTRELLEDPGGERARKVMLITLPSGRRIPVNYLREGDRVYAGADGRWWRELLVEAEVSLWVQGAELRGRARAVRDEPEHTAEVFARLRPNAIEGFGTLVEIRLDGSASE